MKKLFFAICFIFTAISFVQAKPKQIFDINAIPKMQPMQSSSQPKMHNTTSDEFKDFLQERISQTVIEDADKVRTDAFFAEPSPQTKALMQQQGKSEFEKIYDQAMQRIRHQDEERNQREDIQQPDFAPITPDAASQFDLYKPGIPMINVTLPVDNIKITVPAIEHIPYLRSNLELLPDGTAKIEDTVVVVADGKKLKNGLTKVLPKYTFSREGKKSTIDYTIISVQANDQEIPYKIIENNDVLYMIPKEKYELETGVYTYTFHYLAHNILSSFENIKDFYWNATGDSWNLVISRAAATITLPPSIQNINMEILSGRTDYFRNDLTRIFQIDSHKIGIISLLPIFPGNGLHIIFSFSGETLIEPSFIQKALSFFDHNGDVIISFLTMFVIAVSFYVSWFYIKKNKGLPNIHLKQNAVMLRYLAFNRFDLISFGSFLLELYRKNIIDIQKSENTILLIKKTDNLQSMEKRERQALQQLFTKEDAVLNAGKVNFLKIKRAAAFIKKDLKANLNIYLLKMNGGYLFFSLGMLLIAELYISILQVNTLRTFTFLAAATIVMFFGVILFGKPSDKIWKSVFLKLVGGGIIAPAFVIMSAFINPLGVLFILISLAIIRKFMSVYSQKNGLLKMPIEESVQQKKSLSERDSLFLQGREIIIQQPRLFALELGEKFADTENKNEYNKLQIMLDFLTQHKGTKI